MTDHDAIRRLLAEYCLGTDTGDTERWAGCFTDDVVWEGGAFGRFEGKDDARAYHKAGGEMAKSMRHINSNAAIDVQGDTAAVDSYIQVYDQSGDAPIIIFSGFYRDELVKQNGRWLIRSRQLITNSLAMSKAQPAALTGAS